MRRPAKAASDSTQTAQASHAQGHKWRFDVIGWLGVLIGVVGVTTGYIYYVRTLSYPEITWWSTDQIVFNSLNLNPDIKVVDHGGSQIEHNVYALNVSISNTGTALLERPNDLNSLVRSPLAVSLPLSSDTRERILSASIVAFSEQQPVNLVCQLGNGALTISWDHFDPRSGFRLLLLYTALTQLIPHLAVSVVGMNSLSHIDLAPRMTEVPEMPLADGLFGFLAFFVLFACGILLLIALASTSGWINERLHIATKAEELRASFFDQKMLPFIKRHSTAIENVVVLVLKLIAYSFFPAAIISALVLVLYYQPTLVAFWHYAVPSKQPVAIESPVTNMPCVRPS